MTHDDLVLQAVTYRRNVGADLPSIRTYLSIRDPDGHSSEDDRMALNRLEQAGSIVRVGNQWFLSSSAYRQAKGPALAPEFNSEDAWILLALLYRRKSGPSTLADMIAVADWINHAILTLEEFHGALNRLHAARLIQVKKEEFSPTDKAHELFAKIERACPRGVLDQLAGLGRIMTCPCCGPPLKAVRWSIGLTQDAYERALKEYHDLSRPR